MSGSDMARYGKSIKHGRPLQGHAREMALSVFSTVWSSGASGSRSLNELCALYSVWQVSCYLMEWDVGWLKKAPIKCSDVWLHCWQLSNKLSKSNIYGYSIGAYLKKKAASRLILFDNCDSVSDSCGQITTPDAQGKQISRVGFYFLFLVAWWISRSNKKVNKQHYFNIAFYKCFDLLHRFELTVLYVNATHLESVIVVCGTHSYSLKIITSYVTMY